MSSQNFDRTAVQMLGKILGAIVIIALVAAVAYFPLYALWTVAGALAAGFWDQVILTVGFFILLAALAPAE